MEVGKREIIYLSLHCHHQNDSCIKVGSDESHFNVSVGSDGQSHKTVSTNHNLSEVKGEPKRYRTEVLPLTSWTARPNRLTFLLFMYLPFLTDLNYLYRYRCCLMLSLSFALFASLFSLQTATTDKLLMISKKQYQKKMADDLKETVTAENS